jgi:hypothetical protein
MQRRRDPRCWLIIAHLEHAACRLHPVPGAPPRHKRAPASYRGNRSKRRRLSTPRVPDGVIAHPSAPQFSSSQAVIRAYRWARPPGGTAILMRTGKRRSAAVIIPLGLPGILGLSICSTPRMPPALHGSTRLGVLGRCVMFLPPLLRRERNQARLLNTGTSAHPSFAADWKVALRTWP